MWFMIINHNLPKYILHVSFMLAGGPVFDEWPIINSTFIAFELLVSSVFLCFSLVIINRQTSYDFGILHQDYGIIRGLPIRSAI